MTSQLPQPLQSKVSRADSTTEITQKRGHSLHHGKHTASSMWGNSEGDHKCTCFSIFLQVHVKHHTVRFIQMGVGAALLQDGKLVTCTYRSLTEAKEHYSNIERKLLGFGFALKWLHHYTYGYTVTVQADHQHLTNIWKKAVASSSLCLQTSLLQFLQYDVNFEHL